MNIVITKKMSDEALCNYIFSIFLSSWNSQEELKCLEEEQNMKLRGFREVIDLISASQKPVVSHNSLNGVSLVNKLLKELMILARSSPVFFIS